jgi:hypothetical protein
VTDPVGAVPLKIAKDAAADAGVAVPPISTLPDASILMRSFAPPAMKKIKPSDLTRNASVLWMYAMFPEVAVWSEKVMLLVPVS